jgi:hypothetical protein
VRIGQRKPTSRRTLGSVTWLGTLILAFAIGVSGGVLGWYETLLRRLPELVWRDRAVTPAAELLTVTMDMDFADYEGLLEQRERALQIGVVLPSEEAFVPATVRVADATAPVEVRLTAGLAERLGVNEKWGFQIRAENAVPILGLYRFQLLDPASNNWLNQWAFVQALQREGVLAARYRFVRLVLNGRDWGICAVQEDAANELLGAQGRPRGVIVGFDADLLSKSIAHLQADVQSVYADPVTNLSASDIQYLEGDSFRAPDARNTDLFLERDKAIGLLRSLQRGERVASEIFDVAQYGRFLAHTDLWGAVEGVSLVNLKYYYDAASGWLEPVLFSANPLATDARLPLAATYSDPRLQAAYVQEAVRISQSEYLDLLRSELEGEWQGLAAALRREAGELSPPWDALRSRQENLRRSLNPVQPVFAYLAPPPSKPSTSGYAMVRINVGNVLNLPVEVIGFEIQGTTFLPVDLAWVRVSSRGLLVDDEDRVILRALDAARSPVIGYVQFDIPLSAIQRLDQEVNFDHDLDIQVAAHILGYATPRLTPVRPGSPVLLFAGAAE